VPREAVTLTAQADAMPSTQPAVWFLAGNMLDMHVTFANVAVPDGYDKTLFDWLAGPAPTDHCTAAKRLAEQLSTVASRRLILVGHSSGGVLAMLTALEVPDRVKGLLLTNTGAHMNGHRNSDIPDRIRANFGSDIVAEFVDRCHASALAPETRGALIQRALARPPERFLDAFDSIRRIDLRRRLPQIACPTVIIRGLRDQARLPVHAEELAAGIPDSELMLSDSGHNTPLEDPGIIIQALAKLADRINDDSA
jgi:pimeloyl-ACP methyl ester carboxylesterase